MMPAFGRRRQADQEFKAISRYKGNSRPASWKQELWGEDEEEGTRGGEERRQAALREAGCALECSIKQESQGPS